MSRPRYQCNRPSGIAWLDAVPDHWVNCVVGAQLVERDFRRGSDAELELLSVSSTRGVLPRSEIADKEPRAEDLSHYKVCRTGDIVVNRMSAYQGALGLARQDGIVSPDYMVVRSVSDASPEYLTLLFKTPWFVSHMASRVRGIGSTELGTVRTPRLNVKDFRRIPIALPPRDEQDQIVRFLHRETATIDALIAKQEQLIATLREDRTATITHAVTKGLDPDAEMKESGVEWVGAFPATWTVGTLRRWISRVDSGTSVNAVDIPAVPEEVGVLKTSCVYGNSFRATENKTVFAEELELVSCPVRKGTLIVSRMNTPDLVGAAGFVAQDHPNLYLPDRLWQVTFDGASAEWMNYWSITQSYRDQLRMACVGTSSSMQNISRGDYGSLVLALPPMDEQREITEYLRMAVAKVDAVVAKAQSVVQSLREYRAALITDAVTGKIDVRGMA